jgi:hypothetical protein
MADGMIEGHCIAKIDEQAHTFRLRFQVLGMLKRKVEKKPMNCQDVLVKTLFERMLRELPSFAIGGECFRGPAKNVP